MHVKMQCDIYYSESFNIPGANCAATPVQSRVPDSSVTDHLPSRNCNTSLCEPTLLSLSKSPTRRSYKKLLASPINTQHSEDFLCLREGRHNLV